ncbi:hypothetical protein Q4S45_05180 [Massilia sp. R2A-15]|uniref:hypothetical protein n=1 Tax=Massilia sp. R2A-15 TaxID=3064278 RepID=UPI002732DEB7|nr:hypothetical protein [Massilia sp. R2A-15]WLI90516.1 hypothetical protein Q4S45_05180 [Massilia sp. R2A-15]
MNVNDIFVSIAVIAAVAILYLHLVKRASLTIRRAWRIPFGFLLVLVLGCWAAHRLFGVLPLFPVFVASTAFWTCIAANCYLNFRDERRARGPV